MFLPVATKVIKKQCKLFWENAFKYFHQLPKIIYILFQKQNKEIGRKICKTFLFSFFAFFLKRFLPTASFFPAFSQKMFCAYGSNYFLGKKRVRKIQSLFLVRLFTGRYQGPMILRMQGNWFPQATFFMLLSCLSVQVACSPDYNELLV